MALKTIARRWRGRSPDGSLGNTLTTHHSGALDVAARHSDNGDCVPAPLARAAVPLSVDRPAGGRWTRLTAKRARLLLVLGDGLAVCAAIAVALGLHQGSPRSLGFTRLLSLLALPLWLLIFHLYRLYQSRHVTRRSEESVRLLHAVGASMLATALLAHGLGQRVSPTWFLLLFTVATPTLLLERELARRLFMALRRRGHCLRPVVIAGSGSEPLAMATMFQQQPQLGYRVVGILPDLHLMHSSPTDNGAEGVASEVVERVRNLGAAGVILASTGVDFETSNRISRILSDVGIYVELSCSLRDIDANRLSVRSVGHVPLLYLEPVRREGWRQTAKRLFDVVFASAALLLCLPVLVLAGICIKLTSPGPLFFRQVRVGKHGCRFTIFKLRTMYRDAEERLGELRLERGTAGPDLKVKHDPRVTVVGRVLRRLSIDELPQLFNVIIGDMSLVGPRPALTYELPSWSPRVYERLRVRPGMTGLWQVSGRNETTYHERHRLDLFYVDNWSLGRDLAILWTTIFVVLRSKGAY